MRMKRSRHVAVPAPFTIGISIFLIFSAASSRTIKIMPLGDSITRGNDCDGPSYRYFLDSLLNKESFDHDFVGSRNCPADWDTDNEGHGGWTTKDILTGRDSSGSIHEWAERYKADVFLVHLGTNDIGTNVPDSEIVANMETIVSILRNSNPSAVIFVAKIIPMAHMWGFYERGVQLNSLFENLTGVQIVDQFSGFSPTDFEDAAHPNASGYLKIAEKWSAAILSTEIPVSLLPSAKEMKSTSPPSYNVNGQRLPIKPASGLRNPTKIFHSVP